MPSMALPDDGGKEKLRDSRERKRLRRSTCAQRLVATEMLTPISMNAHNRGNKESDASDFTLSPFPKPFYDNG